MKNTRVWLIGGLFATIILMAIGYAALSQELNIFGTANINAEWKVEITDIQVVEEIGANTLGTSYIATLAGFEVDLLYPGASASYDVVVTNNGTIKAKISSITINESIDVANVSYTVTGNNVDDELVVGGTHVFTVMVEWNEVATDWDELAVTETIDVSILYVQDPE